MPKLEGEVQAALNRVKAAMAAYSGPDDSPPARICRGLADAVQGVSDQIGRMEIALEASVFRLQEMIQTLENRPRREVMNFLRSLEPEYRRTWKLKRWMMIGILWIVSLSAVGVLAGIVEHDIGAAESQRWAAWCASVDHQMNSKGEVICQVPMGPMR